MKGHRDQGGQRWKVAGTESQMAYRDPWGWSYEVMRGLRREVIQDRNKK